MLSRRGFIQSLLGLLGGVKTMALEAWPWAGTSVGQATSAPYTDKWFRDFFQLFLVYDRRYEIVADTGDTRYPGGLQVQNNTGANIRVLTGVGIVNGNMFRNTTNMDLGDPDDTPSIRTDLVAVRTNVTTSPQQTVEFVILKGTDGNNIPPALTQNDATRWEVALAEVDITPGPVIATIRFVGRAIRTPLGPGYQYDVLVNDDSAHVANDWNSLDADAGGVKVTLGPGRWEVSGTLQFAPGSGTTTPRGAQLYNVTLSAEIAQGSAPADATLEPVTIALPRTPIDLGVITEVELRFYARHVGDTVYGSTVSGLRGLGTSIIATRIV